MTDENRTNAPFESIKRLNAGAAVLFRHYGLKSRIGLGKEIKALCKENKLAFIVSNDFVLAKELDSDGLHLPEHAILNPPRQIRFWLQRKRKILTAAVHSHASLARCARLPVDAVLLSPVFYTKSHPNRMPLGPIKFQTIAHKSPLPIYALGGLNDTTARRLINSPAVGFAGIGALS